MRLHALMPLVCIDLETTGLSLETDRVVELAAIRVAPDGQRKVAARVNPGCPIPAEATAVHGITDADVAEAPTFAAVLPELEALMADARALVTFNGRRFDLPMLSEEVRRTGKVPSWEDELGTVNLPVLDVRDLDMALRPRTLAGVYAFWTMKTELSGAHSAEADALATLEVLSEMAPHGAHPDWASPQHLQELATPEDQRGALDSAGWFVRTQSGTAFARGKHKGALLRDVLANDRSYLTWMLDTAGDIPPAVKRRVRTALDWKRSAQPRAS